MTWAVKGIRKVTQVVRSDLVADLAATLVVVTPVVI
jgi:hypothetical protein